MAITKVDQADESWTACPSAEQVASNESGRSPLLQSACQLGPSPESGERRQSTVFLLHVPPLQPAAAMAGCLLLHRLAHSTHPQGRDQFETRARPATRRQPGVGMRAWTPAQTVAGRPSVLNRHLGTHHCRRVGGTMARCNHGDSHCVRKPAARMSEIFDEMQSILASCGSLLSERNDSLSS